MGERIYNPKERMSVELFIRVPIAAYVCVECQGFCDCISEEMSTKRKNTREYMDLLVTTVVPTFLRLCQEVKFAKDEQQRFYTDANTAKWKRLVHNATEYANEIMDTAFANAKFLDVEERWEQYSSIRKVMNLEFGKSYLVAGCMRTTMW